MNETEKAYIAGLLDGEGCITIIRHDQSKSSPKHKSPSYRLAVSIYNTNKTMMDWVSERIEAYRYYKREKGNNKPLYILTLSAKGARAFLCEMRPYLVAKSEQLQLALELQDLVTTYRIQRQKTFPGRPLPQSEIDKRDAIYQQVRFLNSGWKWRHKDYYQSSLRDQY